MPLAYIAVRCDPCDTKRSMEAVSQSPQRNARFAKSVCNAAGPTAKVIFYFQPLIGIRFYTIVSFRNRVYFTRIQNHVIHIKDF